MSAELSATVLQSTAKRLRKTRRYLLDMVASLHGGTRDDLYEYAIDCLVHVHDATQNIAEAMAHIRKLTPSVHEPQRRTFAKRPGR